MLAKLINQNYKLLEDFNYHLSLLHHLHPSLLHHPYSSLHHHLTQSASSSNNFKIFYSATTLTHIKKLNRVNIQRVEAQFLSTSEVLEKIKLDDKVKKSKQLKKSNIDSEASDEVQQVQHSKKRRQDKDIKRCKSSAEFGKKHCQLKKYEAPM